MRELRNYRLLPVLILLVVAALVFGACAAAETTTAPADGGQAAAAPSSDLPAEPGRGTDGTLNLLYWQAVSIINPYQSTGTKDYHAGSLVLESLLEYDPAGNLIPTLAQEVPTVENGGVSEDLTSITYKLVPDVLWADGTPLTADDFVFTWQYCVTPETGCTSGNFSSVQSVEAVDPGTVRSPSPRRSRIRTMPLSAICRPCCRRPSSRTASVRPPPPVRMPTATRSAPGRTR